jgi:hypothetical protein
MQTLTEAIYRLNPPGSLFDESVVRNLFPDSTTGGRKLLVHRAIEKDEVLRLKPGLYCLSPAYRKSEPHPFIIAAALHSPSHVSLESALSYHDLIPEAVFQVSSVTIQRSRSFKTPLGTFVFFRIPSENPKAGVESVKVDANAWAFVASPFRAIADLIYLRKEVNWEKDGLRFLTDSLRIEEDDLRQLDLEGFDEVCESFRNRRTRAYMEYLRKELER